MILTCLNYFPKQQNFKVFKYTFTHISSVFLLSIYRIACFEYKSVEIKSCFLYFVAPQLLLATNGAIYPYSSSLHSHFHMENPSKFAPSCPETVQLFPRCRIINVNFDNFTPLFHSSNSLLHAPQVTTFHQPFFAILWPDSCRQASFTCTEFPCTKGDVKCMAPTSEANPSHHPCTPGDSMKPFLPPAKETGPLRNGV